MYLLFWWHNCYKANSVFPFPFGYHDSLELGELDKLGGGCALYACKCSDMSGSKCPYLQEEGTELQVPLALKAYH